MKLEKIEHLRVRTLFSAFARQWVGARLAVGAGAACPLAQPNALTHRKRAAAPALHPCGSSPKRGHAVNSWVRGYGDPRPLQSRSTLAPLPMVANPLTLPAHSWYSLGRWRKRQRAQLLRFPLCAFCLKEGKVTAATCVDHIEPHRGDWMKFNVGKLQSLCVHCHQSRKQQEERLGYRPDTGADGYPLDPKHPCYR